MKLSRILLTVLVSALLLGLGVFEYSDRGVSRALKRVTTSRSSDVAMRVHDTHLLKVKAYTKNIRWYSRNKKIVAVNKYGRLYAKKVGVTTVYAVTAIHTYHWQVIVDKAYIHEIDCIGDSITYGTGVRPYQLTDSYPAILNARLSYNVFVRNYGAPSHTLQKEGDQPYYKTGYLNKVETDQPDVILFMLGTNDCKGYNWNEKRFINEYTIMIDRLKKLASHPDIYIMIPPQLSLKRPGHTKIASANIEKLPKIIRKIGRSCHVHVIDLHTILNKKADYTDQVHPNKRGNEKIVNRILSKLNNEYYL